MDEESADGPDGGCLSTPTGAGASSSPFDDTGEPLTQPMVSEGDNDPPGNKEEEDSQEDILSPAPGGKKAFGYLIPMQRRLREEGERLVPIEVDCFTVGRSVKNAYVIGHRPSDVTISKLHFELCHDDVTGAASLVDRSSNGTYVDDRKATKGRRELLSNNAYVSLSQPRAREFIYLSANKDYQRQHPPELRRRYIVSRELGKGACGTVYLGVRKDDHRRVAIKAIDRGRLPMMRPATADAEEEDPADSVLNEVRLLRKIDHPCVIKLEDVIEAANGMLYIILELAQGGELFDKVIEKSRLAEAEAKVYFYQLVSAIEYLHGKNICHRDLKPENILLCSEDDSNPVIKVTDLGLSKFVDVHTHLKTFCGTPLYLAPEVLVSRVRGDGSYDLKCDMWSLGVILYILLSGAPPFNSNNTDKPLARQITEGDYDFPRNVWGKISKEAINLVKKLLKVSPKSRLSAQAALQHPWLQDAEAVAKARELMGTQRDRAPKGPNGITPPEADESGAPNPLLEEPDSKGSSKGNKDKKPPPDDDLPPACKRLKI